MKKFVKQIAAAGTAFLLGMPVSLFPFVRGEEETVTQSVQMEQAYETETYETESESETEGAKETAAESEADCYETFITDALNNGWNESDARQTAELAAVQGISAAQLMLTSGSALLLSGTSESEKLPYTAEEFLQEAVTRLGASYIWGGKGAGYCAACTAPSRTPVGTRSVCYANGYDCSGFVYDTMSHFGLCGDGTASVSGPSGLPLSAGGWIAGQGNSGYLGLSYQGHSGHLEYVGNFSLEQFQDGLRNSSFQPGDIIVEYDATGSAASHVFFYFGDYGSKEEVVTYLTGTLGVPEEQARTYTVDEGNIWAGGTHWRIEAHGSETHQGAENGYFVRVNNSFEGKGAAALFAVWRQPVIPEEEPAETGLLIIQKQDADNEQKRFSGVTFDIYTTETGEEGTLITSVTTGEDGTTEATELPLGTYYIREREDTVPEGYLVPAQAWAVVLSEQGSSVYVELENNQKPGRISLQKTDEAGNGIPGVVFGVYTDEACQNPAYACVSEYDLTLTEQQVQIVTGEDGYGETVQWLKAGQYFLKEISGKDGYWQMDMVYSVQTGKGAIVPLEDSVINERIEGQIRIHKLGETLSGYQDGGFVYSMVPKAGIMFEISAAEDIIAVGETEPVYRQGDMIECVVTDQDGYALSQKLPLGTYQVKEITSADGLLIHEGEEEAYQKTVVLSQPESYEESYIEDTEIFENYYSNVQISVYKTDADGRQFLEGVLFGLFTKNDIIAADGRVLAEAGTCIERGRTKADGYLHFQSDIPYGEYEIRELEPRLGYAGTTETQGVSFWGGEQSTYLFEYGFKNTMMTGSLKVVKTDAETGSAQNPATLKGAVFGLYAAEDIVHPDGKSGILFGKDCTVTDIFGNQVSMITDENGVCQVGNLYPGKYYIRELMPSEGYLLNQNIYPVEVKAGMDEDTAVLFIEESLIKGKIAIRKYSKAEGYEEMPVLAGAVFCVYPTETLCYLEDGSIDYKNSVKAITGENGSTEMITNEEGEAVSILLPYGTYLVHEEKAPDNHIPAQDFEVTIGSDQTVKNEAGIPVANPSEPLKWEVVTNRQFTVRLTIAKRDSESKILITKPAGFRLYSETLEAYLPMGSEETEIFYTDKTGTAVLPHPLTPGKYWLEEVSVPQGYCFLKQKIHFEIMQGIAVEAAEDSEVTHCYEKTMTIENIPVKGRIEVYKQGEVLMGYHAEDGFIYTEEPVSGTVFSILADEDIFSPETDEMLFEKDGIVYKKDTEIAQIITGEDGTACLEGLPLGRYRIEEREAPRGFVKSGQIHTAVLAWKDSLTRIVTDSDKTENCFMNDRPLLQLQIIKTEKNDLIEKLLPGAVFALYNRFDIVDCDGNLLVKANTRLAQAVSDQQGTAKFGCDLPCNVYMPDFDKAGEDSMYYIVEEKAPEGYLLKEEKIENINLIWKPDIMDPVVKMEICAVNEKIPEEETSVCETEEDLTEDETIEETGTETAEENETETEIETTEVSEPAIPSSPLILGISDFSVLAGKIMIAAGCVLLGAVLLWKIQQQKE